MSEQPPVSESIDDLLTFFDGAAARRVGQVADMATCAGCGSIVPAREILAGERCVCCNGNAYAAEQELAEVAPVNERARKEVILGLARRVRDQRAATATAQQAVRDWEATGAELREHHKAERERTAEAETLLREAVLTEFWVSGDKHPISGCEVKEITVAQLTDKGTALEWCYEHRMFLAMEETALLRYAKSHPLPFVSIDTEPRADLATDMTKALLATEF